MVAGADGGERCHYQRTRHELYKRRGRPAGGGGRAVPAVALIPLGG